MISPNLLIILLSLFNLGYVMYGPVCDFGYYPAIYSTFMMIYFFKDYAVTPIVRSCLMAAFAYWMTGGDIPRTVTMYALSISTNGMTLIM